MNESRRFYHSVYWKLSVLLVLFITASGLLQLYVSTRGWRTLIEELEQQTQWDLAEELAAHIQPHLSPKVNQKAVEESLFEFLALTKKLDIYLVEADGSVRQPVGRGGGVVQKRISTAPLEAALSDISPDLPLYGDDPKAPGRKSVFSTARIKIEGRPGYLYIVLAGFGYEYLVRTTGQYYLTSSIAAGIAIATIFAVFCGLILFAYLAKHLRRLAAAVREYERGNFQARLPVRSRDEIADFSRAVNSMAERIEAMTEELKRTDRLRRELVATVSHDLKGPLGSVRGFLELLRLKGDQLSAAEREQYLQRMHRSILGQEELIRQLFELSRLEAREQDAEFESFDAGELVRQAAAQYEPEAKAKDISLSWDCADDCPLVRVDVRLMSRVLQNLIGNALRYTPEGGEVTISAARRGGAVRISVNDSGVGIPPEELPHVFDSFFRARKEGLKDPGGTGLGLAIVARILALHDSPPHIESAVGRGTTVYFELPPSGEVAGESASLT